MCKKVLQWAKLLGLEVVPVLYRGLYVEELLRNLYQQTYNGNECEGYVVRIADAFHYRDSRKYVGKYVRKNHVQTHNFWRHQEFVPNVVVNPGVY